MSDTDWEAWDAQFEADAQNGRLDAMFERLTGAVANIVDEALTTS